jgi:hypothetical protein
MFLSLTPTCSLCRSPNRYVEVNKAYIESRILNRSKDKIRPPKEGINGIDNKKALG